MSSSARRGEASRRQGILRSDYCTNKARRAVCCALANRARREREVNSRKRVFLEAEVPGDLSRLAFRERQPTAELKETILPRRGNAPLAVIRLK